MKNFVGCDISQKTIDVQIRHNGENIYYVKINNHQKGFEKLAKKLADKNIYQLCMESTGNYYEDFADYFSARGYAVSVINPLKIKKFSETTFQRTKTDKQDAKLIATYCENMKPEPNYLQPSEHQYKIKRLMSYIRSLNQDLVAVKNRIACCKDDFVLSQLKMQQHDLKGYLKSAKVELAKLSESTLFNNLLSIPSIGASTAAVLTHYLSMFHFESANKFVSFAGLSPQITESGESVKKKDRLSHYGNRILKGALYMAAVVAYRIQLFSGLVERMKRKGKKGKVIIVAIMRKLATLAFTLYERNEPYRKPINA